MIIRTFNKLKFKRTYIGGSKEKENEIFLKTQGVANDFSDCDWFEFRRICVHQFDDKLNVIYSWKYITSVLFIISSIYTSYSFNILFCIITFILGLIFLILRHYQQIQLRGYDFALGITISEVKKISGLDIQKN